MSIEKILPWSGDSVTHLFTGKFLRLMAMCLVSFCIPQYSAFAQDFPNKPIRFVVPYGAGQTPDTIARSLARELNRLTGQTVFVENKVGADGVIAFDYVINQLPADGYTIVMTAISGLATLPVTAKGLRFDPVKDLPPLVVVVEGKYIFAIPASLPFKTFNELVAQARANPGKMNYGTSNSTNHLQTEAILNTLGLNVVHVPYRASNNYVLALGTAEVQMGLMSEGAVLTLGPRARVVAVTGDKRSTNFPEAATFAELGLPEVRGLSYSVNVRAGTPKAIFDRLESLITQAMQSEEIRSQATKLGLVPMSLPSVAAAKRVVDESVVYANVAKKIGLQPN